jgi:DNA modification methylase
MAAFALRADGWYLRRDIIWAKSNPMPESVTDRPTTAHEYVFLLTKGPRYYYDADAIREPATEVGIAREHRARLTPRDVPGQTPQRREKQRTVRPGIDTRGGGQGSGTMSWPADGRNKRSVWTIPTKPYPAAHFATFPPDLVEPCVLAGSAPGHLVLDPFAGAATTGLVATRHGRSFLGVELNPEYVELGRQRIRDDAPLMNYVSEVAA